MKFVVDSFKSLCFKRKSHYWLMIFLLIFNDLFVTFGGGFIHQFVVYLDYGQNLTMMMMVMMVMKASYIQLYSNYRY